MFVERAMHYGDTDLLAYLDGALSWWQRIRVRRHLQVCWRCRSRAHAQEQQILQLTQKMEAWEYPGSFWHLDQQLELGRRLRSFERLNELQNPEPILRKRWTIAFAALVSLIVAVCFIIPAPPTRTPRSNAVLPAVALAGARNVERTLYQRPVEQTLAVQVEHVLPAREVTVSQLQIWSDSAGGRFVSRWTASDGSLKEALWRKGPGQEYLLRPAVSRAVVQRVDHPSSDRITDFLNFQTFDDLESVFIRWMESRSWAPVSFAPEAAEWMSVEGAIARAEYISGSDGSRQVRIKVERRLNGARATLTVDFDRATLQPRRMSIHCESDGRVAELQMIAKGVRSIQASEVNAAILSPEIRRLAGPNEIETLPETAAPVVLPVNLAAINLAERTTEAQFVLHAAGACLGEPVLVEDTPGGVRVRSGNGTLGRWPEAITSSADLADVLGALADLRDAAALPQTPRILPAAAALAHARALRLLAQGFPRTITSVLPERSRHILESMLQSHIEGVRSALGSYDSAAESSPAKTNSGDWREATALLYEALSNPLEPQAASAAATERVRTLLLSLPEEFASETRRAAERAELPRVRKR
jgi:hypothetical protein